MSTIRYRCRLVLIAPDIDDAAERARVIADALKGGDVATVIVPGYGRSDDEFQRHAEALVPVIQAAGAAALIVNDSRVAGRAKADGMHIDAPFAELADAVEKFRPKLIVGAGRVSDRHQALEVGELDPDYVFFGKIGGDIKPEPHPKNLALGEWWASMVSIPCIIMGGTDPASVLPIAETGAEFAALSAAVFAEPGRAAIVVAEANALLDEKAPRFE